MVVLIGILVVFQGFVKPKLVRTKVNDKISILRQQLDDFSFYFHEIYKLSL